MQTKTFTSKLTWALATIAFMLFATQVFAQGTRVDNSEQFKNFTKSLADVNISFDFPQGFKEIRAVNSREFPFNYAMELPGQNFEIWFGVRNQKDNQKFVKQNKLRIPLDSAYTAVAQKQASVFSDDNSGPTRDLPDYILSRYNADAGKIYLLNLNDSVITKHYKYALLIVLTRYEAGTLLAVCFTNNKGPDFFKNMYMASNCLKFKASEKP